MKKVHGEIILIDEQKFEKELLDVSLDKLRYEIHIKYLNKADDALDYLKKTKEEIFLVIADFHLKKKYGGLQLKEIIDANKELKKKSVPFIFTSENPTRGEIAEAYRYNIQGFFKKSGNMLDMGATLETIIKYWILNKHPDETEPVSERKIAMIV